jgi:hypothetical protein
MISKRTNEKNYLLEGKRKVGLNDEKKEAGGIDLAEMSIKEV